MRLDGKVSIITGAAAGIGEASARLFARKGARLVLVDRAAEPLAALAAELEAQSTVVLRVEGDVTDASLCRSVVCRTMAEFGRIDILCNNAGIVLGGTIIDCSEEDWQQSMDTNLKSMYLLCREVVPVMRRQGTGSIINMGALSGPTGVPNRFAYSVSKAGVIGLTKSLAMDFAKEGIRVNCVCPATIDTPSLRQRIASAPDPEEARRAFIARQPMGRLGTADEIAAMALFLASDDCPFLTGQAIWVDGGMKL